MLKLALTELEQHVDPEYRARVQKHFNMDVSGFMGVPTPRVRKVAAATFRDIKQLPFPEILALCEEALETGVYECRILAFEWVFRKRKSLESSHFQVLESWLFTHVDDWPDCDDLCTHALGYLLANHPDLVDQTLQWTESENRWARRAAAVSLIYGLRRGLLLDKSLLVAERLMTDSDPLVQKGYGWMLKVATKHFPDEVFAFVIRFRNDMPRTALRYAIEKLPANQRQQALGRSA